MWHDVLAGAYFAVGAAIIAGIGAICSRIPPLRQRHTRRTHTLNNIADEFTPNGGGSLYDRVTRTERNIEKIGDHLGVAIERGPIDDDGR